MQNRPDEPRRRPRSLDYMASWFLEENLLDP